VLRIAWKPTGNRALDRLGQQFVDRVARFARGGSVRARYRKVAEFKRFLEFLADHFPINDIANIQPRHVAVYIAHRRASGVGEKTILNELATIRWWHCRIPWRKYDLPPNSVLFELEVRLRERQFAEEIKRRYRIRRRRHLQKPNGSV